MTTTVVTKQPGEKAGIPENSEGNGYSNAAYTSSQQTQYSAAGGGSVTVYQQPVSGHPQQYQPPGLAYLSTLSRVNVHQVLHAIEVVTGFEKNNQYRICNAEEQEFLHAKENTDCCTRQWCGVMRNFDITLVDMTGVPWMHVHRDLHCQGCCCPCCLQEMDIEYPMGNKVATIKEIWTCCVPRYEIHDTAGQLLFKIEGPCCYIKCCTDVNFKITKADGQEGGEIIKHWGGCREIIGRANDFSVVFDRAEDPVKKAIIIGSTFLVDFMYFERQN